MRYSKDIYRLRRLTLLGQVITLLVLLFGLVSLTLFFNPSLVGVPEAQQDSYRGDWVWLATGIFFIMFAGFYSLVSVRWCCRLIWILNNVRPETMNLSIEIDSDSDSTNYYAILSANQAKEHQLWKVSLLSPSWDVKSLTDKQIMAKVYLDPKSRKPSVIETEFGLLWRMAGNGAAHQLG